MQMTVQTTLQPLSTIQLVDISLLKNRFKESPSKRLLAARLRAFKRTGELYLITVNRNYVILDGLSQWYIAKQVGLQEVPIFMDLNATGRPLAYKISTASKLRALLELQDNTCYICGEPCALEESTIVHIVPLCKGGAGDMRNLAAAHALCNQLKGSFDLTPELITCIKRERAFHYWGNKA